MILRIKHLEADAEFQITRKTRLDAESVAQSRLAVGIAVALVPLVFFLCNPLVRMGINDDWQYAHMAKVWADTGHLRYEGWTEAMVGPHAAWGAAVIKLFGFSFEALRVSMIPITAGCVILAFLIATWIGISAWPALLAVLALELSPLFIPLETVFMTDAMALFLLLLTIWCMLRAASAASTSAIFWMSGGALAGFAAGCVRQIMWGAPILMLAALLLLRRNNRTLLAAAAGLLIAASLAIPATLHWLYAQPFAFRETLAIPFDAASARRLFGALRDTLQTFGLLCLPALVYLLGIRSFWRKSGWALAVAFMVVLVSAAFAPRSLKAPWIGNTVTEYGILSPGLIPGTRPVLLGDHLRFFLGAVVFLVSITVIVTAFRLRHFWTISPSSFSSKRACNRLEHFWWITLPFFGAYLLVILVRSLTSFYTDRYLLPLIAIIVLAIMAIAERMPGKRRPYFAWAALLVFAWYGITVTHDAYRMYSARLQASDRLMRAGIARECMLGGYEFDGWTEMEDTNHIVPPDKAPPRSTPVDYYFFRSVPHVKPKYYLVSSLQATLLDKPILDIPYEIWLGHGRQHVMVQADRSASCPGPGSVATLRR
jgi:Dolichyl-phosphate-mannose-protein mannosyltransferase